MAEERAVCLAAVDGTSPCVRDRYVAKGGVDPPKRPDRASDAGSGILKRLCNLTQVGMRATSLAECYASVPGRSVIVDHQVLIRDAFIPGPTNLRQPFRNWRRG